MIEICLKYFLEKNSQMQPLWVDSFDFSPYHIFDQILSKVVYFTITYAYKWILKRYAKGQTKS